MVLNKNHWYYLPVNPDPWAVGPLQLGRRNGKVFPTIGPNLTLKSFQEELRSHFPEPYEPVEHDVELEFFFWRRLDKWVNEGGKTNTRSIADATNMQKACEDALQGILIVNDRQVKDVSSHVMAEGADVVGGIALCIRARIEYPEILLPGSIVAKRDKHANSTDNLSDNSWPPKGTS